MKKIGNHLWVVQHEYFSKLKIDQKKGQQICVSGLLRQDPNNLTALENDRWTVNACERCYRDFLVVPGVCWGPPLCFRCLTPGLKRWRRRVMRISVLLMGDPFTAVSDVEMRALIHHMKVQRLRGSA